MEQELKIRAKMVLDTRRKFGGWESNFVKFAEENIKILPKDPTGGMVSFEQNDAQKYITERLDEQLEEKGKVRAIILKARQQGISTYCTSRVFWKTYFTPFSKSVIIAHDSNTSSALLTMSKNLIKYLPKELKPEEIGSNAKEIIIRPQHFEKDDSGEKPTSRYSLLTAGSPEAGRGTTPTILHASEVAFWTHDEKILSGLFQGVSNSPGTEVILESTANGADGEFYRLWNKAVEGYESGDSEYMPIFCPWFITKEYSMEPPEDFELTFEEDEYKTKHSLTDAQIYWRRLKINEGGVFKFRQEYPAIPEEAFLTSGSNVFDQEKLRGHTAIRPECNRLFNGISKTFEDDPYSRGELEIWQYPGFEDQFCIGADVSMGIGQDYSTAVVMNNRQEIVALYRNNLLDPDSFGDLLFYLGRYYNNCLLAVENNNMGTTTVNRLERMSYPNLYHRLRKTTTYSDPVLEAGWKTTGSSKPVIIGHLKRAIEERDILIPSKVILKELRDYVMDITGKTNAMRGSHDDTVIATAICLEVLRTHSTKLTNTVNWNKTKIEPDDTSWF